MGTPNHMRRNINIILTCALAFVALLYAETRMNYFSFGHILTSKARHSDDDRRGSNRAGHDLQEFNRDKCSFTDGKWIFNRSNKPPYSEGTCPYLDGEFTCAKNGRVDSDYRHWEWKPDDCMLPRFDPIEVLRKLEGKRLMFVGDSLQRQQWQSFVCQVESVIPEGKKSMIMRGGVHSVFEAKEHNATIEFFWAPMLVESTSDYPLILDQKKKIVKVDSIEKYGKHWVGVDILVFNTYVWWMNGQRIKSLRGSFANGKEGYEELDREVAYTIGLKTWANWVDSNVDPNRTRVFFTTMSPTHLWSAGWGKVNGTKCFNETRPIIEKRYWGRGSNKGMMSVVAKVLKRMNVPVTLINITQLSEYRVDAHASIFGRMWGKLLTDEEKADPLHHADCIHWCLPGVPDVWNQILHAHLVEEKKA